MGMHKNFHIWQKLSAAPMMLTKKDGKNLKTPNQ